MPTRRPRPPKSIARALGSRIAELRNRLKWSQMDLADECGMHRTFIAGVEVGRRNPSLASLVRIAQALKVSVRDLFAHD